MVQRNGQVGLIDSEGQEVVPLGRYEVIRDFSEGLGAACRAGKGGYLDPTGREAIPCTLDYAGVGDFHENHAAVRNGEGKWGYIDQTGREVIPCRYDYALSFSGGLGSVRQNDGGGYGYVDQMGREVVPCQYGEARDFSQDLASVGLHTGRNENASLATALNFTVDWSPETGAILQTK